MSIWLALGGCAAPSVHAELKEKLRPVILNDLDFLEEGAYGASMDVSSDGSTIAIERDKQLRIIKSSGQVVAALGEGVLPQWSPDGTEVAFYSDRSGSLQIWLWSRSSARLRQVTDIPNGVDADPSTRIMGAASDAFRFAWAPDSRRIAFVSRVAQASGSSADGPLVLDNSSAPDAALAGIFSFPIASVAVPESPDGRAFRMRRETPGISQVFSVDIQSGRTEQITGGSLDFYNPIWTVDGREIIACVIQREPGSPSVGSILWKNNWIGGTQIIRIEPIHGRKTTLVSGPDIKRAPTLSGDGGTLAYVSHQHITDPGKVRLVQLNADSAEPHEVKDFLYVWDLRWNSSTKSFFVFYRDSQTRIGRVALNGKQTTRPIAAGGGLDTWAVAPDGSVWLTRGRNVVHESRTGAAETVVLDFAPRKEKLALGRTQMITWRNSRGEALQGWLLLPPDYDEKRGRKYPLIVDVYPLRDGAEWMIPLGGNQAWASAGYVVFRPSPRAPLLWMWSSRAPGFAESAKGSQGWQITREDVLSGIDAVGASGYADTNRACVFGHSNGGGVASYLIGATDRFKCAVIVSPALVNWLRDALLSPDERELVKTYAAGADIELRTAEYVALSPVFNLHKVRTPLLIAAGDDDGSFLLDAIEVYNGVRLTGTEVTLLRYPHQGHLLTGGALRDFWTREMAFFAKHLGMPDEAAVSLAH